MDRARYIWRFARLVREPLRFALAEYVGAPRVGGYRPRGTDLEVFVRHRSGDLYILEQIFGQRVFAWPPEVAAHLEGRDPLIVLDLGAHVGLFASWILTRVVGAEVTAVEPDDDNRRLLQRAVDRNGLADRLRVVPACASTDDGTVLFAGGHGSTSHIVSERAADPHARPVPARDVLPLMARSDLVKIDIEGGEWPLLRDARFGDGRTAAVALEYHPASGIGSPRAEAIALLGRAGFATADVDMPGAETGMLWAWR
jgi:FkbM family methyltransferase